MLSNHKMEASLKTKVYFGFHCKYLKKSGFDPLNKDFGLAVCTFYLAEKGDIERAKLLLQKGLTHDH